MTLPGIPPALVALPGISPPLVTLDFVTIVPDIPTRAFAPSALRRGPGAPWSIHAVPPPRCRLLVIEIILEFGKLLHGHVRVRLAEFTEFGKFGADGFQIWGFIGQVAGKGGGRGGGARAANAGRLTCVGRPCRREYSQPRLGGRLAVFVGPVVVLQTLNLLFRVTYRHLLPLEFEVSLLLVPGPLLALLQFQLPPVAVQGFPGDPSGLNGGLHSGPCPLDLRKKLLQPLLVECLFIPGHGGGGVGSHRRGF